jgi:predicted RecB family endonuclease
VHYESFKNFTASIQSIITSVALVGGGVWAYWRFVLNRESAHKVDVDVEVTFVLKQDDNWIIEAVASVKNLGNSISRNRSGERGITLVGRQTSIESYLSTSHRDSTAPICRFAAVGSELRLSGKDTKAAATEALERLIAALSAEAQGSESARRDAIAALSTMIGAMVLARIAGKTNLSSEILDAAKDYLHR